MNDAVGSNGQVSTSTDLDLHLTVESASTLGGAAEAKFVEVMTDFASEVFDEAQLLELGHRGENADVPEFTSTHIADAYEAVRKRRAEQTVKKRSWWRIAGQVSLYLLAIAAGVGTTFVDQTWGVALLTGSAIAGLFIIALVETSGTSG